MRRTFEVVNRVKETLIEQSYELLVLVMSWACASQIRESMMFAVRRVLKLRSLLVLLLLLLESFEVSFAEGFPVERGKGVVA